MKCLFRVSIALAAVMMFGLFSGVAHGQLPNQNWTGGGDGTTFLDAANWDSGTVVPGVFDALADPVTAGITNNFIEGNFTVERSVDSAVNFTTVNDGAVLNILSGIHGDNISNVNRRTAVGTSGNGTLNQSGGTFTVGHALRVGTGGDGANGVYNLSGGSLLVTRSSNSALGAAGPAGGRPTVELGSVNEGSAGLLEISGDATFQTRTGLHLFNTGTFSVLGSDVAEIGIGSNQSASGLWFQFPEATLRVGLDSGGVTPILVDLNDGAGAGGGNVTFEDGAILDPFDFDNANNAWTTVMEWDGTLTDNGLGLSTDAATAGWEMQIVGSELQVRNPNLPDPPLFDLGDFDMDGDVDLDDVDELSANYGPTGSNTNMDLVADGTIDLADHDAFITTLVPDANGVGALVGDLNLDGDVDVSQISVGPTGVVNVGDASVLLASLGTTTGATYAQGDLNGDGDVDVSQISVGPTGVVNVGDASRLLANLGQSTAGAPAASAVPEPSNMVLLIAAGVGVAMRRRK